MSEWNWIKLDEYIRNGQIELGRGNIISRLDIEGCPGPYPIYSSSATENGKFGEYGKYMFNEELISWSVDGGGSFFYRPKHKFSITNVSGFLRILSPNLDYRFVYYLFTHQHAYKTFDYTTKAHPSVIRKLYSIPQLPLECQKTIADIISALDDEIEQTEKLIEKYQQIKAGMMHDLFTRGVTPDGHLRPSREQAPHLYKQSPLGWIPKDWTVQPLRYFVPDVAYGISRSLDDDESGIPIIRMNNLVDGCIDVSDIKFSHSSDATRLLLKKGDVLFNRTNSLEHVGKTALWRGELSSASFASYLVRLDVDVEKMRSSYLGYWLNLPETQSAMRCFATPAVHQVNINPTNLRRINCAAPAGLVEQDTIIERTDRISDYMASMKEELLGLNQQKQGLMHDLLTGRVPVNTNGTRNKKL